MKRNSKVFFRPQVELILILNPFIKKLAEKLSALARIKKALSHPRSENIAVMYQWKKYNLILISNFIPERLRPSVTLKKFI